VDWRVVIDSVVSVADRKISEEGGWVSGTDFILSTPFSGSNAIVGETLGGELGSRTISFGGNEFLVSLDTEFISLENLGIGSLLRFDPGTVRIESI
jgi:hypothetical protein